MFYLILIAVIVISDGAIKYYIEKNKNSEKEETILNGTIIITKYHNKGAMLNFMENNKKLLIYFSGIILGILLLIFAFLLPKKKNKILKIALALILGGAASNFYDRITKGYVVDYFSFKWLRNIVFNISDLCIFAGTLISTIKILISKK